MHIFATLRVPVRALSSYLHYKKEVWKPQSLRLGFLVFIVIKIGIDGTFQTVTAGTFHSATSGTLILSSLA